MITILQFGDTPTCIDQGEEDFYGRVAKVQGYGVTEDKTSGTLLETNVTIITNKECYNQFRSNISSFPGRRIVERQMCTALPLGLNNGFLCAQVNRISFYRFVHLFTVFSQGIMNDEGIFSGSCKGDSGGPLTAEDIDGRQTLIGIVSGKISIQA